MRNRTKRYSPFSLGAKTRRHHPDFDKSQLHGWKCMHREADLPHDGWEAEESLGHYFRYYCEARPHQGLGYRTPAEVYQLGRRLNWPPKMEASVAQNGGRRSTRWGSSPSTAKRKRVYCLRGQNLSNGDLISRNA